jgi:hypothetical protein
MERRRWARRQAVQLSKQKKNSTRHKNRARSRAKKPSTLADLRKAVEVRDKNPAKFRRSSRLKAVLAEWTRAERRALPFIAEAGKRASESYMRALKPLLESVDCENLGKNLSLMDEAARRYKVLVEDLPSHDAAEVLLASKKLNPPKEAGKLSPGTVELIRLAVKFSRAGLKQRAMAPLLFPHSSHAYDDTRKFFNRYRSKITSQLGAPPDTSQKMS